MGAPPARGQRQGGHDRPGGEVLEDFTARQRAARGERWNAWSAMPLRRGEPVRVRDRRLTLGGRSDTRWRAGTARHPTHRPRHSTTTAPEGDTLMFGSAMVLVVLVLFLLLSAIKILTTKEVWCSSSAFPERAPGLIIIPVIQRMVKVDLRPSCSTSLHRTSFPGTTSRSR